MRDRDIAINDLFLELHRRKSALATQERINKEYEVVKDKFMRLDKLNKTVTIYLQQLKLILERAKLEDQTYRARRIGFIEQSIEHNLAVLFPEESITPRLEPTVLRGKNLLSLVLTDSLGNSHTPTMYAGGMMKSAISYAASMSIINLIGTNKVFIDEAFGVGSDEKKAEMGELLREYLDSGVQVILVSQGTALFQNLPRREFHLAKDPVKKEVVLTAVKDLGV